MSNEHRDGFGSTPELAAKSGADVDDSTADSSGPGDSSPPAAVSTIPFSAFLTSAANALLHEYRHPPEGDRHFTGLSAMKVGVYAITMYAVEGVQRGLQALHVCGQSHGDVKPDNVVMQWDRARFSTRDVLVEFGQTWIGADLSLLSLRAAAAHLHSNAECAPRVSLIDVSDDVVTPKYAPAVSLGGRADDDYAWGLTLIEALVEAEHIGRRFRTSVYHETDAVTALSLPECQQLAPLFRHGGATAEALVTDASLLRLRATPSCSVLRADLELFAACSDAGFDIIDTDSDDAHFLPSVVGSPANDVKRFVAFLEARPLSRSRIQALDEIELPWRAALVVLDRAHRNAGVGTEAATQLQRLRARVLDFTRRGIAAEGGFVPWEAIMRWHSSLPAQTLATVEEKPPRQALGRWPGTANQQRAADLPFDESDGPPFGCPKDLDLSQLPDHGTGGPSVAVTPRVLRLPQGYPLRMTCGNSFYMSPIRRVLFHPDTLYTTLGSSGMCYANNLTIVDFRGLKQLFSFGTHALQFCKRLTAVCMRGLPKLERLDQGTFAHCPKLSIADCRDCLLRESSAGAFTGNAKDLCVLIGEEEQRNIIRESTAEQDRAHVTVLTSAELAHRRAESDNEKLHRCPVCEGDDDGFDATLYDSDSEND